MDFRLQILAGFVGIFNIGAAHAMICYIGGGATDQICTVCSQTVYGGNIVKQVCTTTCSEGYDPQYGSSSWINCCYSDYCNGANLGSGPATATCYTGGASTQSGCTACSQVVSGGGIVNQQCAGSCSAGSAPQYGKSAWTNCCYTDYCNGAKLGGGPGSNRSTRIRMNYLEVVVAMFLTLRYIGLWQSEA